MAKFVDLSNNGFPKYSLPLESITYIESVRDKETSIYFLDKVITVPIPYEEVHKIIQEANFS